MKVFIPYSEHVAHQSNSEGDSGIPRLVPFQLDYPRLSAGLDDARRSRVGTHEGNIRVKDHGAETVPGSTIEPGAQSH